MQVVADAAGAPESCRCLRRQASRPRAAEVPVTAGSYRVRWAVRAQGSIRRPSSLMGRPQTPPPGSCAGCVVPANSVGASPAQHDDRAISRTIRPASLQAPFQCMPVKMFISNVCYAHHSSLEGQVLLFQTVQRLGTPERSNVQRVKCAASLH